MKCLIELGTDLTQRDSSGYSALLIASLKVAFIRTHPKYEANFINFRKCLLDFLELNQFSFGAFLGERAMCESPIRCR